VRAFRPAPGAWTTLRREPIKVWRAQVVNQRLSSGAVTPELVVGCGENALQILELQRPGGKRLAAAEFLRGHPLPPGARLE
jgi:methionyl-tRNA formyltransferase